jgi:hypothetical protein
VAAGYGIRASIKNDTNNNNTRRTFEAFEGRVNAELVERALGVHDLYK